jgi:quinol monooxygenase YgiN
LQYQPHWKHDRVKKVRSKSIGQATFGIFDTFANEAGLQAHLNGAIARSLFAKAEELFAKSPQIQQVEIFAAKPL